MPLTTSNEPAGADGGASDAPKPGDLLYRSEWETERTISHQEAREIAGRLIASHFRRTDCETARASIPARPDYDDDLLINAYIKQQARKDVALASTARAGAGDWVTPAREMIAAAYGVDATAPSEGQMERMHRAADALGRILAGSPAVPASPISMGEGTMWPAGYQATFNAIAAATKITSGMISVNVRDFYSALAYPETASPPAPAEHGAEIREALQRFQQAIDDFDREAADAHDVGERPDLWDHVAEVPIPDLRAVILALSPHQGPDTGGQGTVREGEGRVAERVASAMEDGGWWHSCTGCHETVDGHETGHYPYSEVYRCHVGAGCSECGGIGVVWFQFTEADAAALEAEFAADPAHSVGDESAVTGAAGQAPCVPSPTDAKTGEV